MTGLTLQSFTAGSYTDREDTTLIGPEKAELQDFKTREVLATTPVGSPSAMGRVA